MEQQEKASMNQIELRICANPDYLCIARQVSRRAAELAQMSKDEVNTVMLAVEEALTNVIRHSYGGPCDKEVILQIRQLEACPECPAGLEIIVRDFGRQVDPATIKGRNLDDFRPGGLGVHIILSIMDQIEYTHQNGGGMQLRMIKYI